MTTFDLRVKSFLHFCRNEKGLAKNSLDAYRRDLVRLGQFVKSTEISAISLSTLRSYLDGLRTSGLANRSIARQVTTLRCFFAYLVEQDEVASNPTDLLTAPKIGTSLPKYLDTRSLDRLLLTPTEESTIGLRDRAMLDLSMPPVCVSANLSKYAWLIWTNSAA